MGIWDQLSARTLFGTAKASASEVNAQEKDIHIEEKNRALLTDTVLINKALMRDGGTIPGSGAVAEVTDTTGDGSPVSMILEPAPGESFEISGGEWKTKNSNAMYLRIYDGDGTTYTMIDYKTSVGILEITTGGNFKVVYPQTLRIMYGTATGDNTSAVSYCRIR